MGDSHHTVRELLEVSLAVLNVCVVDQGVVEREHAVDCDQNNISHHIYVDYALDCSIC